MSLIPRVSFTDFKKLKAAGIVELKSCEVVSDGQYLFTIIIPPREAGRAVADSLRAQAANLGVAGNAVGGKSLPPHTTPKS